MTPSLDWTGRLAPLTTLFSDMLTRPVAAARAAVVAAARVATGASGEIETHVPGI